MSQIANYFVQVRSMTDEIYANFICFQASKLSINIRFMLIPFRLFSLRANQALSILPIFIYLFTTSNLLPKPAIRYSHIFEHGGLSTSKTNTMEHLVL